MLFAITIKIPPLLPPGTLDELRRLANDAYGHGLHDGLLMGLLGGFVAGLVVGLLLVRLGNLD